jgi:hypothetical protein
MAKVTMHAYFWTTSEVIMMSKEDKYFYFYLLSNPTINHIEIYQLTKRQMAFELGYPIDTVDVLMKRFTEHYKLI